MSNFHGAGRGDGVDTGAALNCADRESCFRIGGRFDMSDQVAGNAHGVNGTGDFTEVGVGMTAGTFDGDT